MRLTCEGCPCLESKRSGLLRRSRPFCFWYQGWVDQKDGCGNSFEEKPELTQQQLEEKVFGKRPE